MRVKQKMQCLIVESCVQRQQNVPYILPPHINNTNLIVSIMIESVNRVIPLLFKALIAVFLYLWAKKTSYMSLESVNACFRCEGGYSLGNEPNKENG